MFLSLPTTVDKVHSGDSDEDQQHRREERSLHFSKPTVSGPLDAI